MIKVGDPLPHAALSEFIEVETEGCSLGPNPVDPVKASENKTIALFAVPGAFTPTCSAKHVPGYIAHHDCLLYTSPSPRDGLLSRMPSSA